MSILFYLILFSSSGCLFCFLHHSLLPLTIPQPLSHLPSLLFPVFLFHHLFGLSTQITFQFWSDNPQMLSVSRSPDPLYFRYPTDLFAPLSSVFFLLLEHISELPASSKEVLISIMKGRLSREMRYFCTQNSQ